MSSISIPEPCHENWADFTPTQKGAFCGSCQIDVVDFSNKTPDEVKAILKENAGKHMCGRFRKSQLDELNHEFAAWEHQSTSSFQSKFLYACLIVFGMSLFTSCNMSEQNFLSGIGIEWNDSGDEANLMITKPAAEIEKDTTKKNDYKKGKVKYEPEQMLLGKPAIIQETPPDSVENCTTEEAIKGNVIIKEPIDFIKGDVAYIEEPVVDTIDTENVDHPDSLYNDQMFDGEISWIPEFEEFIEDTVQTQEVPEDSVDIERHVKGEIKIDNPISEEPIPLEMIEDSTSNDKTEPLTVEMPGFEMVFEAQLFPNPAQDQTRIVINVKDEQMFNVYLYAINGKMVKDIYNGMLASGRQEFVIDLAGYESGSYLIVINAGKQKESLKLEKLH